MKLDFNREYWGSQFKSPDWYIKIEKDLNELIFPIIHKNPEVKTFRHKVYELVEELLEKDQIPLAKEGPNFDIDRKPIDTIIIHHTEEESDIRLSKLSAIGFIRQYGLVYLKNDILGHQLKGQPIWSGHFRNEKMVFFAYHWLVRPDGSSERLLKDGCVGWHSGVWEINTKSVAIALSGDYEENAPPTSQIEGVAKVIKDNYPQVAKNRILGHREVREGRTCPGAYFLKEWKKTLLDLI
ncbi:MAG TPA: peptidoglycan recognition family protein [Patescibacteria group bacterium]|nr:peptidoglycan recognition family protein [Patescibacteria group bacterium]